MTALVDIPVDDIRPNPDQPRKQFDSAELAELAASITVNGLMQPVTVTPTPDGGYLLVAGERRWRACKLAALPTIRALVRDGLSADQVFTLAVTENVLRADMTLLDEADAFGTLRTERGLDAAGIAVLLGADRGRVERRLALLDLHPDLRAMVAAGTVKIDLAVAASRLDPAAQQTLAVKLTRGDFPTDGAARLFCRAASQAASTPLLFGGPVTVAERERRQQTARQVTTMWAHVERAAAALDTVAQVSAADLAADLGDDVVRLAGELRELHRAARRAADKAAVAGELLAADVA